MPIGFFMPNRIPGYIFGIGSSGLFVGETGRSVTWWALGMRECSSPVPTPHQPLSQPFFGGAIQTVHAAFASGWPADSCWKSFLRLHFVRMVCAMQSLGYHPPRVETGSVADITAPRRRSALYVTELQVTRCQPHSSGIDFNKVVTCVCRLNQVVSFRRLSDRKFRVYSKAGLRYQ